MNEKDKKYPKTLTNRMSFSYAHHFYSSSLDTKNMFMAKKAHKIMSALYILTELLPDHEPLRADTRKKSSRMVSLIFHALSQPMHRRTEYISKGQNLLEQSLCLLETMQMVGYISEMNAEIVSTEIYKLQERLSGYFKESLLAQKRLQANTGRKELVFEDDFFGSDDMQVIQKSIPNHITRGEEAQRGERKISTISPRETREGAENKDPDVKDTTKRQDKVKDTSIAGQIKDNKEERHEAIIDVLMRKREAQLPEICEECTGYSSKTIQRDLKELIKKGLVVRRGDRRWSVYSLFVG